MRRNNYDILMQQAKLRFLTYDQQELIGRCSLQYDDRYLYFQFLNAKHRICRQKGDLERLANGSWTDANTCARVLTVLDWLCDSKQDRFLTGRFINVVSAGPNFHRNLQEDGDDPTARCFEAAPQDFCRACEALGGRKMPGGDISYAIGMVDGLEILVQFWFGDEEFPARLRFLWDEHVLQYIRYETTWYACGLLLQEIKEKM